MPGSFTAGTHEEVVKHAEVHAVEAHGEDPSEWSDEDRRMVQELSRATGDEAAAG